MEVEDAIMISGDEYKLRFTGIHFRPGMLLVDNCADESTVKWLKEKAPQLQKWEGTELKKGVEIPKTILVKRSSFQVAKNSTMRPCCL